MGHTMRHYLFLAIVMAGVHEPDDAGDAARESQKMNTKIVAYAKKTRTREEEKMNTFA